MIHVIEESLDVKLNNIMQMYILQQRIDSSHSLFHRTVRAKAVAIITETCFADWFQNLLNTLLYQPVPDAWNAKRSCFSVWLWYVLTSDRPWPVSMGTASDDIPHLLDNFFGRSAPNVSNVQFVCS